MKPNHKRGISSSSDESDAGGRIQARRKKRAVRSDSPESDSDDSQNGPNSQDLKECRGNNDGGNEVHRSPSNKLRSSCDEDGPFVNRRKSRYVLVSSESDDSDVVQSHKKGKSSRLLNSDSENQRKESEDSSSSSSTSEDSDDYDDEDDEDDDDDEEDTNFDPESSTLGTFGSSEEGSIEEELEVVEVESHDRTSKNIDKGKRLTKPPRPASETDDSGDENCEKCAICLRSITKQPVGSPEGCDHIFCSVCLIEWSKNSNVCPMDRQPFGIILVRQNKTGQVVQRVEVDEPQPLQDDEDTTFCELCGANDREDLMLLCDGCDRGFHTECLTPPLTAVPAEDEWYCPDCASSSPLAEAVDIYPDEVTELLDQARASPRLNGPRLRPRTRPTGVRTRHLSRIWRIVHHTLLQGLLDGYSDSSHAFHGFSDESSEENLSDSSGEDEPSADPNQPSTSGLQIKRKAKTTTKKTKRTKTGAKKRKTKKRKVGARKTVKRKSTKKKVEPGVKRQTTTKKKTSVRVKKNGKTVTKRKRKTVRKTKIVTKGRRKVRRKRSTRASRGPRVVGTPKTVKGRLALTLGMVPPKKPGQLLPDVKIRPRDCDAARLSGNRSRAGIPTLHIFAPRNDLQFMSSGSEHEDGFDGYGGEADGEGGVAALAAPRINLARRITERKQAVLALRSADAAPKPRPVIEQQAVDNCDILSSILESQAFWHSKNGASKPPSVKSPTIDVQSPTKNTLGKQTPMYPGSRPGGYRPYGNAFGTPRTQNPQSFAGRGNVGPSGSGFDRFGAPRSDREGYANYFNNSPSGPTPFCRGGPPLRFRMPTRPQLRRGFPPRSQPVWQQDEEEEDEAENAEADKEEKKVDKEDEEEEVAKTKNEEVDLYSDIEGSEPESYPALAAPPQPPPFLLGLSDDVPDKQEDKSDAYDPADPCDSEEEMVIDEQPAGESTKIKEREADEVTAKPQQQQQQQQQLSDEDDDDNEDDDDCPIFSIYSSTSREFSQKDEAEREREIAQDRMKRELMKMKYQEPGPENDKEKTPSPKQDDSEETTVNSLNNKPREKVGSRLSFDFEADDKAGDNSPILDEQDDPDELDVQDVQDEVKSRSPSQQRDKSRSRTPGDKSPSPDYDNIEAETAAANLRDRSSSPECRRSDHSGKRYDEMTSDEEENELSARLASEPCEEAADLDDSDKKDGEETKAGSDTAPKVASGLEGLEVEEVSSENEDVDEFNDQRSISSLSLSDLSNRSKKSRSPVLAKKKRKRRRRKGQKQKNFEEGEIDDSEKEKKKSTDDGNATEKVGDENSLKKLAEKKRKRTSRSVGSDRQVLGSKENKKQTKDKSKDKDLSWKKPSKKEKNYREGKKRSKERGRSRSRERRKSRSLSKDRKDKKKSKDRRKRSDKKKEIERYDVRKVVKNKDVRKTDAFGRDIVSKSRSPSHSRSPSPPVRARNTLRRESRSVSRSRSRSFRRGRSPVRRRVGRSRSRSKSARRSFSRSRSRSNRRKKKVKSKDSRSRGWKSKSASPRGRRRSLSRSKSRSPPVRGRNKKPTGVRSRRSWSNHLSRSPSFVRSRTPVRVRRSYSRSVSRSWSRGASPVTRDPSLEKLTVVLTTKDKKKVKKKRDGKKSKRYEEKRKKAGNSKEVFASGDNVLVSVNFRNNNNTTRNTRLERHSPVSPINTGKKKRASDYETDRTSKKKKSSQVSKNVVDVALSNASHCPKRKKLTRLSEKDAEIILNRKPLAVIDLDMSPYREQTPSPINVVVVSDSGSGDEGKEAPQRPAARNEGGDKGQDVGSQSLQASGPSSPVAASYLMTSAGPKTPPEPQVKFSISKPQQLRPIVNPLAQEEEEEEEEGEGEDAMGSLDRRIEKELESRNEGTSHKGPNTPPAPRGPTTPSPQTSPDAYDPFEPTKSRSPSPGADKENRLSPGQLDKTGSGPSGGGQTGDAITIVVTGAPDETGDKSSKEAEAAQEQNADEEGKGEVTSGLDGGLSVVVTAGTNHQTAPVTEICLSDSPDRKLTVVISTSQSKLQSATPQKSYVPAMKQPLGAQVGAKSSTPTTQTGLQRLQHRLGSPVNSTSKAPSEMFTSGNYLIRNVSKRNGEAAPKVTRPLQDATNETIDNVIEMNDSPYSPASSEGDDLFDPPMETTPVKAPPPYKPAAKPAHKSPAKQANKFDLLFGPSGPNLPSPLKVANKKMKPRPLAAAKPGPKSSKKGSSKRGISMKMDEDQLRILDELPSSAVELQVKDKFLKKLNRQERVVDEVKTVLKPHYARKHITKEEYKDILRRSVPKICHSRSGEINPSKIQLLIEAYVRKFRHAKKKAVNNTLPKPKKKTMFS